VKKRVSGPSISELRLRQELDQARRDLKKLKGGDAPVASAAPSEEPRPVEQPGDEVGHLQHRIAELERTRERLSRLYFSQRD
jgi:hypothetical protein